MANVKSEYQKMKLLLESYEKTHAEMLEADRYGRMLGTGLMLTEIICLSFSQNQSRIAALETRSRESAPTNSARLKLEDVVAARSAENKVLNEKNARLHARNEKLQEELEVMKATMEDIKAQVAGKGLIDSM